MSIQSEITRISGNISDSLDAVAEKGVTVPGNASSDDLPGLIRSIPSGGEDSTVKIVVTYDSTNSVWVISDSNISTLSEVIGDFENTGSWTEISNVILFAPHEDGTIVSNVYHLVVVDLKTSGSCTLKFRTILSDGPYMVVYTASFTASLSSSLLNTVVTFSSVKLPNPSVSGEVLSL